MHNKTRISIVFIIIVMMSSFLIVGCGSTSENHTDSRRTTLHDFLVPTAPGTVSYSGGGASIDASNSSDGYIMVKYSGKADKAKLQITIPDGTVYSYTLTGNEFAAFPLSGGNGSYKLDILSHAYDNMYAIAFSQRITVQLEDEFKPFLYPNQYVWYTPESETVQHGIKISDKSSNDLDYVEQVYDYVIKNISYDEEAAANVVAGYVPDVDRTLDSGKGICFDYASLMAALLRSQGIPTKLVVGYSGTAYHAWISVYVDEAGWVDKIIEFDGQSWSLMDPTLAACNDSSSVQEYIGDGSNYVEKYSY